MQIRYMKGNVFSSITNDGKLSIRPKQDMPRKDIVNSIKKSILQFIEKQPINTWTLMYANLMKSDDDLSNKIQKSNVKLIQSINDVV